jgi:hypothetical protein
MNLFLIRLQALSKPVFDFHLSCISNYYLFWFFVYFIDNQHNCSYSPDRADILWALGRLLHCPQIKARAGIAFIKMPERVAAENLD